jgi:hypothetical protein
MWSLVVVYCTYIIARHAGCTRGVDALFEVVIISGHVGSCVSRKANRIEARPNVVVVNTTSGWPRPHRSPFLLTTSLWSLPRHIIGAILSILFLTSPSFPTLPIHHHIGPVLFSFPCLSSRFCPFYNHLYFTISSKDLDGSSCTQFASHILRRHRLTRALPHVPIR